MSLTVVATAAITLAAVTAFRLRADQALGLALAGHGARVLLAVVVGAALGAAASLARDRGAALVERELLLFGASAGGALGGALVSAPAGSAVAPLGSLLGAAGGAVLLLRLTRLPRLLAPLFGLAYLLAWYACVYGAGFAKGALDASRARLAFWAGDLSHASGLSAAVLGALILVLSWLALRAQPERRRALELALLGVAIGAAGPIAFVGALGAWLAARTGGAGGAGLRLGLSALAAGAALALADAVQRKLVGGYAFAANVVTGFLAMPVAYAIVVRAQQRREGRSRTWLSVLDHGFAIAVFAFGCYVVHRLAALIASST